VIHAQQVSSRYIDAAQAYGDGDRSGMIAGMKLAVRVLWIAFKKAAWSYVCCRTERLTASYDNHRKQDPSSANIRRQPR
jgi:hypothetical protein